MLSENNNAIQVGMESAMQWFSKVEETWTNQPLIACKKNCGIRTDSQ
jgi:hypothetical protein